jgi:hypothetical protein
MYTELKPTELAERYTVEDLQMIVAEAREAAYKAAMTYINDVLDGQDMYACGFAWTSIHGIKGNTKIGRRLKQAGVEQSWDKSFQIWNPSGVGYQNIDCKEAGARAAALVFKSYGFVAYAGSRLD